MPPTDPLLKTRQVALALGENVSTIKRWVDLGALDATRTLGKHHLIQLYEVFWFAREQGLPHAELERLEGLETTRLNVIDERVCEILVDLLRRGKKREVRTLVHSIYGAGPGAVALADQLVRPVMERVGRPWMVGAMGIYQKHQATHLLASCLIELIDRVSREQEGPAPLALGAASEGDFSAPKIIGHRES